MVHTYINHNVPWLNLGILMQYAVRHNVMTVHYQSETRLLDSRAVGYLSN
jgi:hypothetical protein